MQPQHDYHRELAISLIESVGIDGAIQHARENLWEGVLSQLLNFQTDTLPSAANH